MKLVTLHDTDLDKEIKRMKGPSITEGPRLQSEELLLSYVPKAEKHIVSFAGKGILRPGNICTFVGPSGFGKSSVTEAVISSAINPYCDSLGIRVDIGERPTLWLDGERTRDDIAIGFHRIKRRICIEENSELIENNRFKNVYCYPLILLARREDRIRELERLCKLLNPGLVVLDGAADFVRDVNDTTEAVDFVALLVALANELFFGVVTSIHPNPGTQSDHKPRGVLGSELIRTSESMLLLKRAPDDRDTRILTMDFAHGKNRNQADSLEHYFRWNDQAKMFSSCQYEASQKPGKAEKQEEAFQQILEAESLTYSDLVDQLVDRGFCGSVPTAKRWIGNACEKKTIFSDDGMYKLTPF